LFFTRITQLSLLATLGFSGSSSFTGLVFCITGAAETEAVLSFGNAFFLFVISGVASLSSRCSGDRGVSPAEESSMSTLALRGVLKRLLKAAGGTAGSGLLGEGGRLVLDFVGESKAL